MYLLKQAAEQVLIREINFKHNFSITRRRNGQVVYFNPRDTVDTGRLLRSIKVLPRGDNKFQIKFEIDYAEDVFKLRPEVAQEIAQSIDYFNIAFSKVRDIL